MTAMLTTPTTLPPEIQATADDTLLSVRTPDLIHNLGAWQKVLKDMGGSTLRMSRYDRLPTATIPLSGNGQTPPAVPLNRVDEHYVHVKSFLIDLETEVVFN
jgi:hypothetical protein